MTKYMRKKWSVKKAIEILKSRNEVDVLDELQEASKKDDLADVIVQLQGFKYLMYVDQSL